MRSADPTEDLLRQLAPQVLGAIARGFRDFGTAEDCVQEALVAAAQQWPQDGIPENPKAWLTRVAKRRMVDHLRREAARRQREAVILAEIPTDRLTAPAADSATSEGPRDGGTADRDDSLTVLFQCCHPSLTPASSLALTLRAVGGLTTAEVARAFLVPEATMAQRISRAKQRIRDSEEPFRLPEDDERPDRLRAVLHVLYLIFNEGHTASSGSDLQRPDLADEAVRLTRQLRAWLPEDTEVAGLLALMLLVDARRHARTGAGGELVPLSEQDRSLWDRSAIEEGDALLTSTLSRGSVGPYQVQAAVNAVHDTAPTADETDWPQILALYRLLRRMGDSPVVALNEAIALAMVEGPSAGLEQLNNLAGDLSLAGSHRLDATRAHLLEMAGDRDAALKHYRAAAARTLSLAEQRYLIDRAARLDR